MAYDGTGMSGGVNPFGLGDPGSDTYNVDAYNTAMEKYLSSGRVPLGQEYGFGEGDYSYLGGGLTNRDSFLNLQGPGTYGTDENGINYFAPDSGVVYRDAFPRVGKTNFMDKYGWLMPLGIAGAGIAAGGLGAAGAAEGVGFAGLGTEAGVLGAETLTVGEGASMWDWVDDFVELVGDNSAEAGNWGGDFTGWSTNPSLTDLGGNGFNFGEQLTNAGGLDGPMGDSLRDYFSQMGPNNPFTQSTTGNSAWSSFTDFLKNPLIEGTNATGGNILGSLANYLIRSQQQGNLNDAANRSATLNDPLKQPERLPFQQAFTNLMTNPNGYQQTPFAQGMTNQANNAFQANVSKYGPGGTQFSDYLKNYQNILSSDFFNLANTLSTAGGYNQGTGGAGSAFGNLAGQGANAGMGAFEGFGSLFSQPKQQSIFGQNSPFQITYNPAGNVNSGSLP